MYKLDFNSDFGWFGKFGVVLVFEDCNVDFLVFLFEVGELMIGCWRRRYVYGN